MTDRIRLGSAVVTRVVEWEFAVGAALCADTPPEAWQENADLLVPTFFNPETQRWRVVMHSWVIEVDGLTVVVDPAVVVGDLTHCPIQTPRPQDPCGFDVAAAAAAVTRHRVFTEAARARAMVIPAHYPGSGGATIVARGDRFEVDDWLELSTI